MLFLYEPVNFDGFKLKLFLLCFYFCEQIALKKKKEALEKQMPLTVYVFGTSVFGGKLPLLFVKQSLDLKFQSSIFFVFL